MADSKIIIGLLNPKPGNENVRQIIASANEKGHTVETGSPNSLYIFVPDLEGLNYDQTSGMIKGSLIEVQSTVQASQGGNFGDVIINRIVDYVKAQSSSKPVAKAEPAKVVTAKAEPTKEQPVKVQPVKEQPKQITDDVDWEALNNLNHMKEAKDLFPKQEDNEGTDLSNLNTFPNIKRVLGSI